MKRAFMDIAKALEQSFCDLQLAPDQHADIYLNATSSLPDTFRETSFQGLHVIRDPRDVILSGMHYHQKSKEAWLHQPKSEYGDLTYQQKLRSLDADDQLDFEMKNVGRFTIRQMLDWNYWDSRYFEVRYERLIEDVDFSHFARILRFLGIAESKITACIDAIRIHHVMLRDPNWPADPHIRSGQLKQWQTGFRRRHGEQFVEMFGDCLTRLGYEINNDWVLQLRD